MFIYLLILATTMGNGKSDMSPVFPICNTLFGILQVASYVFWVRFLRDQNAARTAQVPIIFFVDMIICAYLLFQAFLIPVNYLWMQGGAGGIVAEVFGIIFMLISIFNWKVGHNYYLHNLPAEKRAKYDANNRGAIDRQVRQNGAAGGNNSANSRLLNRPVPVPAQAQAAPAPARTAAQAAGTTERVKNLMDITGRPRGDCIKALAASNNDVNGAAEWLFTNAGDTDTSLNRANTNQVSEAVVLEQSLNHSNGSGDEENNRPANPAPQPSQQEHQAPSGGLNLAAIRQARMAANRN
jgi:hypothetical protein